MNVDTFKKMLSSYKDYKRDLTKIKGELEETLYEMTGVKGVRFDREPSSFNPDLALEKKLELIDKYNEKLLELDFTNKAIELIEFKLKKLDGEDKKIVMKILADNVGYESMSHKIGYTRSGMWKKVQRDLKEIL